MSRRLPAGGRIDRARPLAFTFDGRALTGFAGDTLASALLANDVLLLGRSFKYHRPRGIHAAGPEEPNALVTLGEGARREPNIPATTVELREGLAAESQNRWPALGFDLQALNSLAAPLLPAGFYYKTFMGPTRRAWMAYEPWIRRAAGLGRAGEAADPDRYETCHAFCDVAVIGAGVAGLSAALSASRAGARVTLVEQDFLPGGRLLARALDDPWSAWLAEVAAELSGLANLRLMLRTTAFGLYDGGTLGLVERRDHEPRSPAEGGVRQRAVLLRCRAIVFATGAIERPLLFANNDRPGIMLASAAQSYLHRHAVRAGDRVVVATDNDSAYAVAIDLAKAGAEVRLADLREAAPAALVASAAAAGVEARVGAAPLAARGARRIRSVEVVWNGGARQSLPCDLLCVSGGWSPSVHLTSHLGTRPVYRPDIGAFVPGRLPEGQIAAGAVAGIWDTASAVVEGWKAGAAAAAYCGFATRGQGNQPLPAVESSADARPESCSSSAVMPAKAGTQGRATELGPLDSRFRGNDERKDGTSATGDPCTATDRQSLRSLSRSMPANTFVDLQNDVTAADVALACREGYAGVEHLKRYTTLGMGTDQGKTSNWNAWTLAAGLAGTAPEALGTTTFRPPYTPVAIGALAGRAVGRHFRPTRRTPLHGWHLAHGAEMIEVGLWLRPWFYRGNGATVEEAYVREMRAVREAAGLIDISTLGKIEVEGPDALAFLDRVYVNDLSRLGFGRARYAVMLRDDGIVLDDGTVTRLAGERFFLTTSTAKAAEVLSWLEFLLDTAWTDLEVHLTSVTDDWAAMSLAGPRSRQILAAAFPGVDLSNAALPPMGAIVADENGSPLRILRLSYSGELGFEIYAEPPRGPAIWERLMAAGEPLGLRSYGVEALGALRVEKGHVAGPEIDGRSTLADLGLERLASRKKTHIGAVLAERPAFRDPNRPRLVGLECLEAGKRLRSGAALFAPGDATAGHGRGRVTSVTWSPTLGRFVGLGFYEGGSGRAGEDVVAVYPIRNERVRARIVPPVFLDPAGERLRA